MEMEDGSSVSNRARTREKRNKNIRAFVAFLQSENKRAKRQEQRQKKLEVKGRDADCH
jgi:chlorite dismutase